MSDPLSDLAELDGVPSALAAARDAVDAVLADRGRRPVAPGQTGAALLAGARASAALEATSADPRTSTDPDTWTAGAGRMVTELLPLAALIRISPGQAMARLHTLLAREVVGEQAGRLRPEAEVGHRMASLTRLLTGSRRSPALVLAAVAHGEIAVVRPFGVGDGIVARAVEHLVLIEAGVDPDGVLVPEAGHLAAAHRYPGLLAGYADGSVAGVRAWILHGAAALTRGAEESPLRRDLDPDVQRRPSASTGAADARRSE